MESPLTTPDDNQTTPQAGSIRRTVLRSTLIIALVPLLIIGLMAIIFGALGVHNEVESQLAVIAKVKGEVVELFLTEHKASLSLLAEQPKLSQLIALFASTTNEEQRRGAEQLLTEQLQAFRAEHPEFEKLQIVTVSTHKTLFFVSDEPDAQPAQTELFAHAPATLSTETVALFYLDQSSQQPHLTLSSPIRLSSGQEAEYLLIGSLAPRQLDTLIEEDQVLGKTGTLYLINDFYLSTPANGRLTGLSPAPILAVLALPPLSPQHSHEAYIFPDYNSAARFGDLPFLTGVLLPLSPYRIGVYHPLPELGLTLVVDQTIAEAFEPIINAAVGGLVALLLVTVAVYFFASYAAHSFTSPIVQMAETTTAIAQGDFTHQVTIPPGNNELSLLAYSVNTLNERIQGLIGQLEQRVEERTQALDELNRHATQLETSAEVSQLIAAVNDLPTLNRQLVTILKASFRFRYVAIYLTDEARKQAVLNEATDESEQLTKGYGLSFDEASVVGQAGTQHQKRLLRYATEPPPPRDTRLTPDVRAQLVLPLIAGSRLVGLLDMQCLNPDAFQPEDVAVLEALAGQIAYAIERMQLHTRVLAERDRTNILYEVSATLSTHLDFEAIMSASVRLAGRIGASSGSMHLISDTGKVYFKSSVAQRNDPKDPIRQTLIRQILTEGVDAWVVQHGQAVLIADTKNDERWLPVEHPDQIVSVRSMIGAPVIVEGNRLRGAISFVHPEPNHFAQADLTLLGAIASQVAVALENTLLITDIQGSLRETNLLLDISQRLATVQHPDDVYDTLVQSIISTGVHHCTIHMCDELDNDNIPVYSQIVFDSATDPLAEDSRPVDDMPGLGYRFPLKRFPTLYAAVKTQTALIVKNLDEDPNLSDEERRFWGRSSTHSLVVTPLITRSYVVGLISVEYQTPHSFTDRELTLYRTVCNQATIAIEHVRQIRQTQLALTETQMLYRTGRVLAGAADLQEILQEALIEFLYSLDLNQGGITLLTKDKRHGQLMAYVQNGQLYSIEQLQFPINPEIPYQEILLSGRPFVSNDVAHDPRIVDFVSFNEEGLPSSMLQSPMIIQGETIGWVGADAVGEPREFTQREIDLSRAMADQIAITIDNRRLLDQTRRRAERVKAVAKVGEAVSSLIDLEEVFNNTVDLISQHLGFYHVAIFILDESSAWAVVRAATGDVGQVMVKTPHRLRVGSNSIVGAATAKAEPQIALELNENTAQFQNPLLPDTRSEMALPLISRGKVIGALNVQSVESGAFSEEDVEVLQIMANQLVGAIENARLFEQIQRRLNEQATLYRIGTRIGATLDLQEATDSLVVETAEALNVSECVLTLIEENEMIYIISDYVADRSSLFQSEQGERFELSASAALQRVLATKQERVIHIDDPDTSNIEYDYLKAHNGTALAIVPVLLRNTVIGSLEVYDSKPGRRFSTEDISLLDSIALQAANAIENARLYETANESQIFMKAIIDQIPDPIFIKDRNRKWVVVNRAFSGDIIGVAEEEVIDHTDYDYYPREKADRSWQQDTALFETGQPQEFEEEIIDAQGNGRILYTRKIPLTRMGEYGKPDYLIGIVHDITERKLRETERERLIQETRWALERTQLLYRISDVLATTADNIEAVFPAVLSQYMQLLNLGSGIFMLLNRVGGYYTLETTYVEGERIELELTVPVEQAQIAAHLQKNPTALVIDNLETNELAQHQQDLVKMLKVKSGLFIPIITREQVTALIGVGAPKRSHLFSKNDIEIGQTIADHLAIWLENRQLLTEMEYRSNLLQTAAEVARAASSILDVDELIHTSVNLIRDQFDFYYVGLFLLDEAREWAVLRAGTGEPGRLQVEKGHRLQIGGGSMIGWSVEHRRARIALDVGQDAVWFNNPYLPNTHSEMALPLISRDEVIGALTVQSEKRAAFSDEDITLLQTMADQMANALQNARLFAQTQEALAEAEVLYKMTQQLLSADEEQIVYDRAMNAIAQSGIDSSAIYIYADGAADQTVTPKAVWSAEGGHTLSLPEGRLKATLEALTPQQELRLIENIETEERLPSELREALQTSAVKSLIALPLATTQKRLGLILMAYGTVQKGFTSRQLRFYNAIAQQMVAALESIRFLKSSQRRAQREEIIREVTGKISGSTDVEDILKTTVTELSKILGASRANIALRVDQLTPDGTQQTKVRR
jgi:PAS domain S-box-containing protein